MALKRESNIKYRRIMASLLGNYFVDEKSTIRETAEKFGMATSTVFLYINSYIEDRDLKEQVDKRLKINKAERHKRAGNAIKEKFKKGG